MPRAFLHSLLLLPVFVGAQTAPDPGAQEERAVTLEPLLVTGEKVARDIQDTPTSIGVVTAAQIETLGVRDLRDSFRLLPNVLAASANNGNSGFAIRGINSEGLGAPGANLRPLASLTIDGASQSFEGIRRGARGSWDVQQFEVLRGPQSTLQGRNSLAGAIVVKTNDPAPDFDAAARLTVGGQDLFAPAAMVNVPLGAPDSGSAFRLAAESSRRELGIRYSDTVGARLDDEAYDSVRGKLLLAPTSAPGLTVLLTVADVSDKPAVNAVNAADPFARELNVSATTAELRETTVTSASLETRYAPGDTWSFVSTTAWVRTAAAIETPSPAFQRDELRADRDFTQDLRVEYRDPAHPRLEAFAGLFYGRLENTRDSVVRVQFNPLVPPFVIQDLASAGDSRNLAAYAETRLPLGEKLRLTLGARYDTERVETDFLDRQTSARTVTSTDFDAFLPRASLSYDFTPERSLSFSIAQGYRAGFVDNGRPVDPEYLTSYELAWRSTWLDRRLVLNATAFHYDWRDQQIIVPDPLNPLLNITANAGRSRATGGELEIIVRPHRALTVGASAGLLETELVEFGFQSGNEFPDAPARTASLWSVLRLPRGFYVAGDVAYTDRFFGTANILNDPAFVVSSRTVTSATLGYEHRRVQLALSVRNAFDRDYLVGRDINNGAYVGDPRVVTFTALVRF